MTSYNWYNLFSLSDFIQAGIPSRTLHVDLEGVGTKDILITQGNATGMLYDNTFLVLNMAGDNPYAANGYAIYIDTDENVWLGIEQS